MTIRETAWEPGTPSWVDLAVADVSAAAEFYSALFGWTVEPGPVPETGYQMASKNGHLAAGILPKPDESPQAAWTTYLATDDAAATAAAITAAGGTLWMEPFPVGDTGVMTIASDPAGAAFAIWQAGTHPGAQIHAEPGAVTWSELQTHDYAGAKAFYSTVFGHTFADIGNEQMRYATITPSGGTDAVGGCFDLSLVPATASTPSYWLTWFEVADTDAHLNKVVELGGKVLMPADDSPFGRMAVVGGAQGELFGIIDTTAVSGP